MAFNGSGGFARLFSWIADRNAGIKINAARMDQEMDGLAAGLSNTICRDGQSIVSADIPFNGKKLTNIGDANADGDAMNRRSSPYVIISDQTLSSAASSFSSIPCTTFQEFEIDLTLYVNAAAAADVSVLFRAAVDGVPTFMIGASDYIVVYDEMVGSGNKAGGSLPASSLYLCSTLSRSSTLNTMKARATLDKGAAGRRPNLLSRSGGYSTNYVLADYGGYTSASGPLTHFLIQAGQVNGFAAGSRLIVKGRQ